MKLEIKQLSVALSYREIVKEASFAVESGELVGLIGANGSGKSTLLRATAGLIPFQSGTVELDGKAVGGYSPAELARVLAYLPQGAECHWPLTAERVVALGRLPFRNVAGVTPEHDAEHVSRALVSVDALHLRDRVITELSGGERARIFLARALAGDPGLLFIDEPAAGLDPFHHLQLMELLQARAAEGRGVLLVLHDLGMAARFCHRLILIHEGKILASGPAETVLTDELLATAHGISVYRATQDGQPVILPWRRVR